ncbi:ABC transporter permease, partial [Candidatus Bipolaricaulota bacterium]|nr:ABC transporter permease [Candidatus Bipolaricaulota bacterium]
MTEPQEHTSRLLRGVHRTLTGLHPAFESVLAAIVGLLIGALVMWLWGYNPIVAYKAMLVGAFGSKWGLADSGTLAAPLVLTGLTFSICLRAGMFNIGAEGQLIMGGLAAVSVGFFTLPPGLHHIVALIFAMTAGALWSVGPALLKMIRGVHEVISTIMFNWIAHFLSIFLIGAVLLNSFSADQTIAIPPSAVFPKLIRGTDLTYAIFIAIAFALIVYFVLWHTSIGYEVRAAGLNPSAARYGGIRSKRTMFLAFVLGGMSAGLAATMILMGSSPTHAMYRLHGQLTNIGFDGMAVAMVGRNHPIGILFSAMFFGGLNAGGRLMQLSSSPVPIQMVRLVTGVIVFTMAIPELARVFPAMRDHTVNLTRSLKRLV